MKKIKVRFEKDSLGTRPVPAAAYYGIETVRAVENFPISGLRFHPEFFRSLALLKKACAQANFSLRRLDARRARAILKACDEVIAGKHRDHFVTDALQSGAGVSAHMNMNEVLTNRALEILGRKRGDHAAIHSHDHVNMGQSTNDVVPTALRIAALKMAKDLAAASRTLEQALLKKAREFRSIVKAGRTHLQDAAPVTLGQEFGGWARQLEKGRKRIEQLAAGLLELGIGGSAVGTGLNTSLRYTRAVIGNLKKLTGFPVRKAQDLFAVMQNDADFAAVSGALRDYSLSMIQIANDLRLLSSGPNTGFGEIQLPALQPGSSIMPGKVNPVIPEVAAQVGYQIVGNDTAIAFAAAAGECELNVMRPVIVHNLLQSFEILKNTLKVLAVKCVGGIKANEEKCRLNSEKSFGIAAALNPYIGYSKAAECVKEATRTGKTLRQVVLDKGFMTEKQLSKVLSPGNLTKPPR
ncbi:MAG TPA: aspartate ammonia-lyase [Candidatus Omnitrophota bacterium]|nr:aspartate ammonia-lyase [Candidatus Omnitrophota bacterium]HPS36832.1 aspartate ammonia-lyase [Candidatus Omnitrophota bacterium]